MQTERTEQRSTGEVL